MPPRHSDSVRTNTNNAPTRMNSACAQQEGPTSAREAVQQNPNLFSFSSMINGVCCRLLLNIPRLEAQQQLLDSARSFHAVHIKLVSPPPPRCYHLSATLSCTGTPLHPGTASTRGRRSQRQVVRAYLWRRGLSQPKAKADGGKLPGACSASRERER